MAFTSMINVWRIVLFQVNGVEDENGHRQVILEQSTKRPEEASYIHPYF